MSKFFSVIKILLSILIVFYLIVFLLEKIISKNKQKKDRNNKFYNCDKIEDKGEIKVIEELKKCCKDHQIVINNLIIKGAINTTQIDHIVINPRGIFVFETKNLSGIIYGDTTSEYWTQTSFDNDKKSIRNPIIQNENHVRNIKKIINDYDIYSYVILIKYRTNNVSLDNVISLDDLYDVINNKPNVLTKEEMQNICNTLLDNRVNISNKKHTENLKKYNERLENNICPRCGSKLILHNINNEITYRCSNHTNCNYIYKK